MAVLKIPAVYMRGGTSKGVFFNARDLPRDPVQRDRVLLRVLGSPDPYSRQADGMGGASPATSRVVVVEASGRDGCDVEYRCGQVAVDRPEIDWTASGGSLAVAVGPYAIQQGLVAPREGTTEVRIWQPHPGRWLAAHVEVRGGEVLEDGVFVEDGVPFPAAEVRLDFIDDGTSCLLPTGKVQDVLEVDGLGPLSVSLIRTEQATVFARASDLGLHGREKPDTFNRDSRMLARLEALRIEGAVAMGLMSRARAEKPGAPLPRLVWVAPPMAYKSASGADVPRDSIDVLARIVADGRMQRGFGTRNALALAVAAAVPGSVVSQMARTLPGVATRIGHAGGVQTAWATVSPQGQGWGLERATVSRTARCLMSGWVHVPA
ncbi:3-methylitaconate isomerase [Pigmentiphaga humi]|uniref:3-methylitaconate isomerase n=1 Tax=Pigmentiphaga humi TaxID=2478468 RepID=A0A3P4B402_9BURK|nr:PrpF domain-containing protein [Pigmentiphaga humi]VCU70772.1 3-methylitaconate isomerase [Pigmentiphaga humi]